MEAGAPPQKRPRTNPPLPHSQWQQNGVQHNQQPPPPHSLPLPALNQSRSLPPISQSSPHQYGQSPYARSDHQSSLPPLDIDRRHHSERPSYEPPDHRRPTSAASHVYQPSPTGPNHSQSPYSGPREPSSRNPMIKRDPSQDESQYRGSPNNLSDQHVAQHLPHEGSRGPYHPPHLHQQPSSAHFEPQHMVPQQHRTNSYPPPSPMNPPNQYNAEPYPRSGHFQPAEPYTPTNYPPQQGTPRVDTKPRKAQRAAQACDSCRTLKAKCDEGRPKCNSCVEKNQECNYRDPPPKQQDKSTVDIAETLNRMEGILANVPWQALAQMPNTLDYQATEIRKLRDRMQTMERLISNSNAGQDAAKQETVKPEVRDAYPMAPMNQVPLHEVNIPQAMGERHTHVSSKPLANTAEFGSQSPGDFDHQQEVGSDEDDPGTLPPRQEPTIPLGHTTEAANLLEKPGVAHLVKGIIGPRLPIKTVRYAAEQEKRRGQLRFFGRGEGIDYTPGYEKDNSSDHLSESTPGDNYSENSSPAGEYERAGILSPPTFSQEPSVFEEYSADRKLDFSEETIKTLVQSYKDNINNMHPIFTFSHIDKMVLLFLKTQARSRPNPTSNPHASFTVSTKSWDVESPGSKRKRSPAGEPQDVPKTSSQTRPDHPSRPADRSLNTGLVLLILALGKVCLHTKKIYDVASLFSAEHARTNSPLVRNGYPSSPVQNSPTFSSIADINHRSRRQSTEGNLPKVDVSKTYNMDWIPGLDYFAYGTEIIGSQLGGNRLQHVHLGLLAGLYHGQLGRVVDSHAYIFQASRCLQEVLKKRLDRLMKVKDGTGLVEAKDNPLVFAFWTTLQLESDIVAEMPLEQSGILNLEDYMPGPNLKVAEEADGMPSLILQSYTAQLFLRKHLNKIHGTLYRPEQSDDEKRRAELSIDALEEAIAVQPGWAGQMIWKHHLGERSNDILHARLRAKWYGAGVITFRPYILAILEASASRQQRENESLQQEDLGYHGARTNHPQCFNSFGKPILSADAKGPDDIDPRTRAYAKKALLALIHSTSAFHDVADPGSKRLIVTNIWGTAHAQWGNLVTLQAAYNDQFLKPLVLDVITHDELSLLLEKTIAFLNFNGTKNSALRSDAAILKYMGRNANLIASSAKQTPQDRYEPTHNSSFHSVTSADGGRDVMMGGAYHP